MALTTSMRPEPKPEPLLSGTSDPYVKLRLLSGDANTPLSKTATKLKVRFDVEGEDEFIINADATKFDRGP